jgi:hypothetical protein
MLPFSENDTIITKCENNIRNEWDYYNNKPLLLHNCIELNVELFAT